MNNKEKNTAAIKQRVLGAVAMLVVSALAFSALSFIPDVNLFGASYSASAYTFKDTKTWITNLPDTTRVIDMAIPGTHDTATYKDISAAARCQTRSISEQLSDGIRWFDLRLGYTEGQDEELSLWHGVVWCRVMLRDVMDEFKRFLDANPGEVIFAKIKDEKGTKDFERKFEEQGINGKLGGNLFGSYQGKKANKADYWYTKNTFPSLGEVRGKIVMAREYKSPKKLGIAMFEGESELGPDAWGGSFPYRSVNEGNKFYIQSRYNFPPDDTVFTRGKRIDRKVGLIQENIIRSIQLANYRTDTFFYNGWNIAAQGADLSYSPRDHANGVVSKMKLIMPILFTGRHVPGLQSMDFYDQQTVEMIIKSNFTASALSTYIEDNRPAQLQGWYHIALQDGNDRFYLRSEAGDGSKKSPIVLGSPSPTSANKFYIRPFGGPDEYVVKSGASNRYWDLKNPVSKEGVSMLLWSWDVGENQVWIIKRESNGNYSIKQKKSGMGIAPEAGKKPAYTVPMKQYAKGSEFVLVEVSNANMNGIGWPLP
ncbi:MAG: phosphatidylinositol-specific phospholipase C domain-containing protein [Oscillospiraceae bacterium]|nr:phosphatidylinositol-specific phospholipase C domain-containing protein [Oscillospiraceae bacterium]